MEIVTGKAGVPHVSSADDGRRIAGEVGAGSYVLQTGGKLAPSLVDANTVRIATGDMIVQGRHIGVTAPEDVKVASGSQGKKRMDYICVHYTRDVSGSSPTLVEKVEWKVLQGTPGSSAAAPSVPKGSILDGDADVTVPVCSVTFDGLTTGQPNLLIPTLTPLATLGDSVSQTINVLESRTYPDIEVSAQMRSGIVCVNIYRAKNDSAQALTKSNRPSNIGKIKREYWPSHNYVQYIGTKNGTWLLMTVTMDGDVAIYHQHNPSDVFWSYFEGSLSYPIA